MKTARMWPWKSESFKECVTTHEPNLIVSKMDDAKSKNLYKSKKRNFYMDISFFVGNLRAEKFEDFL
jgi:hypothetical protein